ncbi:hypothetical protein KUCAC02_014762, partial [Chaenocephalus aceratus]
MNVEQNTSRGNERQKTDKDRELRSAAEEYATLRGVMWLGWFDPHLLRILHSSTGG